MPPVRTTPFPDHRSSSSYPIPRVPSKGSPFPAGVFCPLGCPTAALAVRIPRHDLGIVLPCSLSTLTFVGQCKTSASSMGSSRPISVLSSEMELPVHDVDCFCKPLNSMVLIWMTLKRTRGMQPNASGWPKLCRLLTERLCLKSRRLGSSAP